MPAAMEDTKPKTNITERDNRVLDLLFNPSGELAPGSGQKKANTSDQATEQDDAAVVIEPELLARVRSLEVDAVQLAENGDNDAALAELNKCIDLCPKYPSAYNNRAQAYRLKGNNEMALEDLNKAIALAKGDRAVLKQAHTQRAIIHQLLHNEDAALADFEKGGKYGNSIAGGAAVSMNPYAKMCNSIVAEVLGAEMRKGQKNEQAMDTTGRALDK